MLHATEKWKQTEETAQFQQQTEVGLEGREVLMREVSPTKRISYQFELSHHLSELLPEPCETCSNAIATLGERLKQTVFRVSSLRVQRRQWQPTPALLPGKSHGQRSLIGCSPWGLEESDTTEQLHFHFSLSFIGEGNGTPIQYPCLENPMGGGALWAAVYGVAQSWT